MKRISKRVREEAAIVCAARATDWALWNQRPIAVPDDRGMSMYSDDETALDLARQAFHSVDWDPVHSLDFEEQWAEAEVRLRTGWSPE